MTPPEPATLRLTDQQTARAVTLPHTRSGLVAAVAALGLGAPRPVVAVVGGAAGLDRAAVPDLAALFADPIARLIRELGATAVDGGTDSGVMGMLGRARNGFPLVGVAAASLVRLPGEPPPGPDFAELEPHHTHFVLVPGDVWGAEAPWLARVATILAGEQPAVTILANGGDVAVDDCRLSLDDGRPVLVLAGTGRTADLIAAAVADPAGCRDQRIARLAQSPEVRVVDATDRSAVEARMLESMGR